jgi:hypothetical protein
MLCLAKVAFPAFGDPAESEAARTDALDKRALWNEIDSHLTCDHLLLRFGVESDVACDRPADKPSTDQLTDSSARHCSIVRNYCETALPLAHEFIDQALGRADAP